MASDAKAREIFSSYAFIKELKLESKKMVIRIGAFGPHVRDR